MQDEPATFKTSIFQASKFNLRLDVTRSFKTYVALKALKIFPMLRFHSHNRIII